MLFNVYFFYVYAVQWDLIVYFNKYCDFDMRFRFVRVRVYTIHNVT